MWRSSRRRSCSRGRSGRWSREARYRCVRADCVNPAHVVPATARENIHAPGSLCLQALNVAKTHCPKGHPLDGHQTGGRRCTTCGRADALRRYYRRQNVH